jgi:hypothetical protein
VEEPLARLGFLSHARTVTWRAIPPLSLALAPSA